MRVEANGGLQISADLASGQRPESKPSQIAAGESHDQATISPQHKQVQSLVTRVIGAPEVRQERVAGLSAAIRNGSYQVSPDSTANALLEQMRRRV